LDELLKNNEKMRGEMENAKNAPVADQFIEENK
jgi:hypothetical protein